MATRRRKPKPITTSTGSFNGRVIGIDVGLANTALAVIDGMGDGHVLALEFIGTDPDKSLRQMSDDWRRTSAIVEWVKQLLWKWRAPNALTVVRFEWFAPRFNMRRGWTTSIIVGAIGAVANLTAEAAAFGGEPPIEVLPASPPLHVQVAAVPKGWCLTERSKPHVLDALTHARLEWLRRTEGR